MKRVYNILSILLLAAMLAACTPAAPAPATSAPAAAGSEATATAAPTPTYLPMATAEAGKIQVRWFVGLGTGTDPEQQVAQKKVVDDYNASQDKIQLILEVVPYNSAVDTLSTEIASGNGPDIVGPVGWSGSNAFYGQWLDLKDLIQKNNYDTSDFDPALVNMYQTEEGTVGLPFATYPAAVFFQKKMFDEAGLAYPPAKYGEKYKMPDGSMVDWNWDTLTKIAKILTVDKNNKDATQDGFDKTQIVQYGFDPQYMAPFHLADFYSGAAKVYTGSKKGDYKAALPDNWKTALQWWYDGMWGAQPFIPDGAKEQSADYASGNPFNGGKVAMAITQSWYTCCIGEAGGNWELAVLPSDANGKVNGRVDADTFRVWKGTKHADETFQVLTYLLGPSAAALTKTYGAMPAHNSLLETWFKTKKEQFPNVKNWDIFTTDLKYVDVPSGEGYMPHWTEAWTRTVTFQTLMQNNAKMDFNAEYDKLVNDLTIIFNK
jgi:multiple sugar transport system substrate-binding protein